MSDCVFCKIAQKQVPASIVYEDNDTISFLDISPIAEGHALVIPKQHVVDIFDIEPSLLQKVVVSGKVVADRMRNALGVHAINLVNASGRAAEQDVFHFHLHVIPRRENDQVGFHEWWFRKVRHPPRDELDATAARLRTH